jgi:hypothetical protein
MNGDGAVPGWGEHPAVVIVISNESRAVTPFARGAQASARLEAMVRGRCTLP